MATPKHRGEPPATNAGRRFPPEVLTDAEVRALMDACGEGIPSCHRNRALIAVLYRGGLRVSEALALYPKDLDAATGAVRVLWGKGGRARTIGLDPGAFRLVEVWTRHRTALGLDARHPLFCTRQGQAITSSYIRRLLNRLGEQAGIQKRVHAHGLRHTHAAQLRSEGVDIGIISKQLGHRSIATTARYLDHIAPWAVVEAMRGREW
ncbi:MAG: tyrosine-type recombinase/integrase [Planctomycetota bacterium]|nr:MAG: tyrosine-type recombinase/integrase [Planctomycetota bacterium]